MSSINNFSTFNRPSLNGLIDINADNVTSSTITSDDVETNSINTNQLYVSGVDIAGQVATNSQKITGISYNPSTPDTPTTSITGAFMIDGGVGFSNALNYGGQRLYLGSIPNGSDIWMWGACQIVGLLTLHAGFFCAGATIDQTEIATLDNIDTSQSIQNQFNNKLSLSGGTMTGNITLGTGSNIIANSTTILQTELSYLSGVTSNIQTQFSNKFDKSGGTISGPVQFTAGIVLNNVATCNYQITCNGKIQCYANIKFNSTAGIELASVTISQTELSYLSGVTSSIQTQLSDKLSLSSGGTLIGNLIVNSTTITPTLLSYLSGVSSNIQTQFNTINSNFSNYLPLSGGTLTSPLIISYNSGATATSQLQLTNTGNSKGMQLLSNSALNSINNFVGANESVIGTNTQNNSSLVLTTASVNTLAYGIRILSSSSTTATITTQVSSNAVIVDQTGVTTNGNVTIGTGTLSCLATSVTFSYGFTSTLSSTFSAGFTSANDCTFQTNIIQSGTTASTNKITQSIVTGDSASNPNVLKYTQIKYNCNSAGGSANPGLSITDNYNSNQIMFIPNVTGSGYNVLNPAHAMSIVGGGNLDNNTITLCNWSTQINGIKCIATNSTTVNTIIQSGANSVNVSNTNGITLTGVSSIGFTGGQTIGSNYGTIYNASLTTTTLTSGTEVNVSSALSLPAGTYNISWICGFHTITGSTTIGAYAGGYTSSTSAFSDIFTRENYLSQTVPVDTYFTTSGYTVVAFASATSIYMRCNAVFGTASRLEFNTTISSLRAVKIC